MTNHFADLRVCRGATLDDLDPDQVEAYRRELARRRPGSRLLRQPLKDLLIRIGAAVEVDGFRPTLMGVLGFGRDPQLFFPSFTIAFLHFAGITIAGAEPGEPLYLDNREFRGTLVQMIDDARTVVLDKISKRAVMDGFVRQDVLEYPEFAYREAIVNAVAHRDYELEGSHIQIRLFADRLEIQSPGGLGGNLTVENMVYEQYTRNPHLMSLLEDYGYVERRGLGVDQMIQSMNEAGRDPPVFENRGSSFWVTLKSAAPGRHLPDLARLGLNDRQVRVIRHLQDRGRITNREYQTLFGVAERTALYDLHGLVKEGLAIPVSSGRGRYYILKE